MKAITKSTSTWTARHKFNAANGKSLQDSIGEQFKVEAMAIGTDIDRETGEERRTCYIVAEDGSAYSSISSMAYEQVDALIDMMDSGDDITILITERPNKQGKRKYIVLELC